MSIRDRRIDQLRSFAMLWVIFVHVLYWSTFITSEYANTIKSFCLFEMPLSFFVTGAANSFGRNTGYCNFVLRRFKRILIPYWVFAIICAVISIAKYSFEEGAFRSDAIRIFISWLIPNDAQITSVPYLKWALWFIPVYLCIVLILPLLKKYKQSKERVVFGILLGALFVVTDIFNLGWIQNVSFYCLWVYIGLFYTEIKENIRSKNFCGYLLCVFIISVVLIGILYFSSQSLDMQKNKFPPNIRFLIFSVMMISLIILLLPCFFRAFDYIEKCPVAAKIFDLYSTHSLTIFLYQVFAFSFTIPLTDMIIPMEGGGFAVLKVLLCLFMTIPACACFAVIFSRFEKN